jgi:hypothetical protein
MPDSGHVGATYLKVQVMMIEQRASTIRLSIAIAVILVTTIGKAADIDANSFRCITKLSPVRQFYVDNLQGNLDATLAVANSPKGRVYPPGSVVQLIPAEVMVKRDGGFDVTTHDWEFFLLDVSKDGAHIKSRGTTDVANRLGTCIGCHKAVPQWDLVCETDHGCAPLPITPTMIGALQRTDPRCGRPISPEDAEALKQLDELRKGSK